MGKTNDIKLCVKLGYENRLLTHPERGLWKPYFEYIFNLKGINISSVNDETYVQYMSELVDIYCINNIKTYKLKFRNGIKTYIEDTNKTTKEYLTFGCDSFS
jgi:hypothetical protein